MSRRCQQWSEFWTAEVLIEKRTKDNDDGNMKDALLERYCSLVSEVTPEDVRTAGIIHSEGTTDMSNGSPWGRG